MEKERMCRYNIRLPSKCTCTYTCVCTILTCSYMYNIPQVDHTHTCTRHMYKLYSKTMSKYIDKYQRMVYINIGIVQVLHIYMYVIHAEKRVWWGHVYTGVILLYTGTNILDYL